MENINTFSEIKNYINHDDRYLAIRENLIKDYEELEKIYSYYYKKQLCEKMEQQLKVSQNQQQISKTEEELSYCGEPYNQQQESTTYQVVTSDLHGDISTFLNILVQNRIIDLKGSYEIVDLKTLKSYDTFAKFKKAAGKRNNGVFSDARCVILPKFELSKDVDVTFNYLGDLIDEGKFSTECFYMMMMLMEKAKSCHNFKINYLAGNHEIANIILESKNIDNQKLRQHTKYYCCSNDKSEYLARSNNDIKPIQEQSHNFQMGCMAKHLMELVKNRQMKLTHIDGKKMFIHANPSIESILYFLNIYKINAIYRLKNVIKDYANITKNMKNCEQFDHYIHMVNDVNDIFIQAIAGRKLDNSTLNSIFFAYVRNFYDATQKEKCSNNKLALNFFGDLKYFVGHDSRAEWEYTFNGSELYCLDGHNNNDHRFVKIVDDVIYTNLVKSSEVQREYDVLQQRINYLENEIAEKNRLILQREIDDLAQRIVERNENEWQKNLKKFQKKYKVLQQQIDNLTEKIAEKNKQQENFEKLRREYCVLQQQFNDLESKIVEKCGQNGLNKRTVEKTTYQEEEGLLEKFENVYTEMPDDKSGCICVPKKRSRCPAM